MPDTNHQNKNDNSGQVSPQSQKPQNTDTQGTWSNQSDSYSYDVFKGYEPKDEKSSK